MGQVWPAGFAAVAQVRAVHDPEGDIAASQQVKPGWPIAAPGLLS